MQNCKNFKIKQALGCQLIRKRCFKGTLNWLKYIIWKKKLIPRTGFMLLSLQNLPKLLTDSTKINRPGYNIRMYWTNFWQMTFHMQQFHMQVRSSHLYASFGTLCVQIGQLFEAQWDFELSEEFEFDVIFLRKQRFYRFHKFFKDTLCLE